MSDLKSMRDELRKLRKEQVKPVSKMRKGDISQEIEKLRVARNETPAAAAVPSAPLKKSKAAVESIKEAKAKEFPVMPDNAKSSDKKSASKKAETAPKKKESKLAKLMALMDQMSDDE